MEKLDHPDWLLREYDYLSGMQTKDMAEKYGVSYQRISAWKKQFGWRRAETLEQLVKPKIKRVLFAAQTELERGELDDCVKRLKAINHFLKTYHDVMAWGQEKTVGKAMHDKQQDSTTEPENVEELRAELIKRLENIVGPEETKAAFDSAGVPIEGRKSDAGTGS